MNIIQFKCNRQINIPCSLILPFFFFSFNEVCFLLVQLTQLLITNIIKFNMLSLREGFDRYPKPKDITYSYGTAGFRYIGDLLDSVAFRIGIIASLRSISLGGKTIGIVITASHNPPEQNGVKVIDPMGEMLPQEWEPFANEFANCETFEGFQNYIKQKMQHVPDQRVRPRVILARDTRASGPHLLKAALDGIAVINGTATDFGMLTTPQLHYLTRCFNDPKFGRNTENGYYEKLLSTTRRILSLYDYTFLPSVIVDTANGIGGDKLSRIDSLSDVLNFGVINGKTDHPELLNVDCGADYVKTQQKLPAELQKSSPKPDQLYASFDGDADRVVCYFVDGKTNKFRLLDGDRIATLFATFIGSLLKQLSGVDITMGIVQTAYANGSSTKFIQEELKLPVYFTPTGVKHLHHKAQQFDVGIYFEANGHGTVLFSKKYTSELSIFLATTTDTKQKAAAQTLLLLADLTNQTVGDSISDLVTVMVALRIMGKSVNSWGADYTELPNRLFKLKVKDRSAFKTTDAERKLVSPSGLQAKLDEEISKYKQGRSFVRASGTEDAVRVYAEAETQEECDNLGSGVCELVKAFS